MVQSGRHQCQWEKVEVGVFAGPDLSESGLVLALDGANYRSFKGEATTNLISDPFALSGFPTPVSWSGYEATVTRTSSLPFGDMYNISSTWLQIDKTSSSNGRIAVLGVSGLQTGVDYCCSFYVYSNDTNLTNINWLSDNGAVSTIQSYTSYTSSDRNTIKRIQTIFRSVSGSQLNVLRISAGDPIGTRAFITGLQVEQKSYPTTVVNGTRGTTVATGGGWADLTGRGNNGELVNGVKESGDNLGSLSFDGTNDYVDCGNRGTIGGTYTIECFFNSSAVVSYRNVYDMNYTTYSGISGNVGPRFEQFSNNTANWIWSGVTNANDPYNFTTPFSLNSNTWYYTAFTMNNGTVNTYVNGAIQDANISSPNGYVTTFGSVNLGRGFVLAGNRYFSGNISNFKIYNRALTAAEIQQNFNATRSRFGI